MPDAVLLGAEEGAEEGAAEDAGAGLDAVRRRFLGGCPKAMTDGSLDDGLDGSMLKPREEASVAEVSVAVVARDSLRPSLDAVVVETGDPNIESIDSPGVVVLEIESVSFSWISPNVTTSA